MSISTLILVVTSATGLTGSLYYGISTLFKRIWMIQNYLATIKEATIYQTKKLDEMAEFDESAFQRINENTRDIEDIQRYLELYSRGQQHPFIIRGKHYEDSK